MLRLIIEFGIVWLLSGLLWMFVLCIKLYIWWVASCLVAPLFDSFIPLDTCRPSTGCLIKCLALQHEVRTWKLHEVSIEWKNKSHEINLKSNLQVVSSSQIHGLRCNILQTPGPAVGLKNAKPLIFDYLVTRVSLYATILSRNSDAKKHTEASNLSISSSWIQKISSASLVGRSPSCVANLN